MRTIGQKIAQAAHTFEKRHTKHGRDWVAVFLNEDTIVIALHGFLSGSEKTLARNPAGFAKVCQVHEQLFANLSGTLHRRIINITGAVVQATTAEIEPRTGRVVHLLTTDKAEKDFLQASEGSAGRSGQGRNPFPQSKSERPRKVTHTGCGIQG